MINFSLLPLPGLNSFSILVPSRIVENRLFASPLSAKFELFVEVPGSSVSESQEGTGGSDSSRDVL